MNEYEGEWARGRCRTCAQPQMAHEAIISPHHLERFATLSDGTRVHCPGYNPYGGLADRIQVRRERAN